MQDILSMLTNLRRPPLLVRAARLGAEDYRREVHLPRQLGNARLPGAGKAVMQLMDLERDMNRQRTEHSAGYSVAAHVEVLIALMGEARLFRASRNMA